jgi:hypothetical protein
MPDFSAVARLLARVDNPPEWITTILARYGELVAVPDFDDSDAVTLNLLRDAEYLNRWLPMCVEAYARVDLDVPECIDTILAHLPDLLILLAEDLPHKGDSRRRVCAALCAEIWRNLHGAIEPHSVYLQKACDEYWRQCGQEPIGRQLENEPRNWERPLRWAQTADDQGFREQIEQLSQGSHTKPDPK